MVVRCRCGLNHAVRTQPENCRYCQAPTFDEHRVCGSCRHLEALERWANAAEDPRLLGLRRQSARRKRS